MFEHQKFVTSVFNIDDLPNTNLPEVILCGRSNVGKSSFINSIFNRKNLAKTSASPGKTRSINYYLIDDNFFIVDLPGYGYAKVSLSERKKWAKLINDFLHSSNKISLAIHLIDSRHYPTEQDIQLNEILQNLSIPNIVLLTKSDKLKQSEFSRSVKRLKESFPEVKLNENLFFFSALNGKGNKEVKKIFSSLFYKKNL